MAAALATWYNNQYSPWNRTRRLQVAPYLARENTNTSRTATEIIQTTNISDVQSPAEQNMGDNTGGLNGVRHDYVNNEGKLKDTLFGPSIGVVNPGPGWAQSSAVIGGGKKVGIGGEEDVLTTEVVKKWVSKSKETSEPTTTLQALVNLKRPTIRLLPLEAVSHPSSSNDHNITSTTDHTHQHQQHGLEFEFDCDAPKCGIYMYINGIPSSAISAISINVGDENNAPGENANTNRAMVFESIVPGGFGKKLSLAEGAMLELDKFDMLVNGGSVRVVTNDSDAVVTVMPTDTSSGSGVEGGQITSNNSNGNQNSRKRLTFFRHNKHGQQRASTAHSRPAAGPALALVDAESAPVPSNNLDVATAIEKRQDMEEGVKVTLRLVAMDAEGKEIRPANEQVTYLHVVRMGVKPSKIISVDVADGGEKENAEEVEDTRPWVVRVIKREAIIGIHTFHLHEIYGLTSQASSTSSPIASLPTSHTYPPTIDPLNPTAGDSNSSANDIDNDTPSECLLCLSSPREVVLLPCRHLVACKECAINMIEFGAGGTVVQHVEEPVVASENVIPSPGNTNGETAGQAVGTPDGDGEVTPAVTTANPLLATTPQNSNTNTTTVTPSRRKRKPKGWFCPVCRQPYTSMLRITTNPPPASLTTAKAADAKMLDDAKRISTMSTDTTTGDNNAAIVSAGNGIARRDDPLQANATLHGNVLPLPATTPGQLVQAQTQRPGFLRHFSRGSARNGNTAAPVEMQQQGGPMGPDLERQI